MGSIYKRKRTRAIPENAVTVTKRGKTFAEWETERGRKYRLPFTEDGKRLVYESKTYYIQYVDENGLKKIEPTGAAEIDVARQILNAKEKRAEEIRSGTVDPAAERIKEAATTEISEHIKKFAQGLRDKGRTGLHVDMTEKHIEQAFKALGWDRVGKMRSEAAQEYLSKLRDKRELYRPEQRTPI